jgi:adenylate cyclase
MFLLFLSNAVGLVKFGSDLWPGINFSFGYLQDSSGHLALPEIVRSVEFLLLLASGLVLIVCLPLLRPIGASLLVLALSIPPVLIAINDPYRNASEMMQFSLLVFLVLFGSNVLMKYFAIARERQKLLDVFGQYLPQQLVHELSDESKAVALEGEARLITVMFCDLRNFTSMAEKLRPGEVVLLLNGYFTAMTEILFKYGATIDKYMGDSIMAFWGAPVPQEDHAQRAIQASFEMHKEIQQLAGMFHALNLPTPTVGIGINTGMVSVGNMGSKHRLAYTAIGDAVNLAFRLQTATRDYRVGTIVGEETVSRYPEMLFRELDQATVRGKTRATRIYEPLCLKDAAEEQLLSELVLHKQALDLWYSKELDQARSLLIKLRNDHPHIGYYTSLLELVLLSKKA